MLRKIERCKECCYRKVYPFSNSHYYCDFLKYTAIGLLDITKNTMDGMIKKCPMKGNWRIAIWKK